MLFNSHAFIFFFLPATLALYFALGREHPRLGAAALAAASFFFYGWWNPAYVWLLFVSFVRNLRAVPLLHAKELMPQFTAAESYRAKAENFSVGLTIFIIGLVKKTVLADGIAAYANPVFAAAAHGAAPTLFEAWGGA